MPYRDLLREVAGKDWFELSSEQRRERATNEFKLEILPQLADFEVTQHMFEKLVEEKTIDPVFRDPIARRSWCRWQNKTQRITRSSMYSNW